MDPYACLRSVREAIDADDPDSARQGLTDYCNWRKRGGFSGESYGPEASQTDNMYHNLWERYEKVFKKVYPGGIPSIPY